MQLCGDGFGDDLRSDLNTLIIIRKRMSDLPVRTSDNHRYGRLD
jgi:hypothetical protein